MYSWARAPELSLLDAPHLVLLHRDFYEVI
jgi:hypothetical protein